MRYLFALLVANSTLLLTIPVTAQDSVVVEESALLTLVHNVKVASRDSGIVTRVYVKPGDRVLQGERLLQLDSELHQSDLASASYDHAIAKKASQNKVDILFAEKSKALNAKVLARAKRAAENYPKSVSQTELEQLQLELERSELGGKQAEHALQINQLTERLRLEKVNAAQLRLKYRTILSPMNGLVAEVKPQGAESITANEVVVRIINLDKLRIKAEIKSELFGSLKVGDECQFQLDGKYSKLVNKTSVKIDATLTFVSAEINPLVKRFEVHAEFDNSKYKLNPGMRGILRVLQ